MSIWLIVTIILVLLAFSLAIFGNENLSAKIYRGVTVAAMAVLSVLGIQMINNSASS
jgi:chromate transport protein ChrA